MQSDFCSVKNIPCIVTKFREEFESNTPLGTIAKPIDVANAVLYFASDVMSGHVTRNIIGTDGGMDMTR